MRPYVRTKTVLSVAFAVSFCLAGAESAQAWGRGGFGGYGSVHYSGTDDRAYDAWSNNGVFGNGGYVGWSAPNLGGGNPALVGSAGNRGYSANTVIGSGDSGGGGAVNRWGGQRSESGMSGAARLDAGVGDLGSSQFGDASLTARPLNYGSIQNSDFTSFRRPGDYGWSSGMVYGPRGGEVGAVQGPTGRSAVVADGAYGAKGTVVRGPAGGAVGDIRGPWGGYYSGARGSFGAHATTVLPSGYMATAWKGTTYYQNGYNFYRPYWYGGAVTYWPVYPPTGWFFPNLPPTGTVNFTVNDNTYLCDGVYYQQATQNGQQGYVVVDNPGARAAEEFPGATAAPTPPPAPAVPAPAPPATAPNGEPNPFAVLRRMSDYLGKQPQFSIAINDTADEIIQAGEKVQVAVTRMVRLQRPDKLAMDVRSNNDCRRLVCDGTGVTTIDLTRKVYGTIPAKGNIDSVLDILAKSYGMAVPADDLLYSDIYSRVIVKIRAAQYLGPETISGKMCDHLAFTQDGVDWQIWVQSGDTPIPRKVVIIHHALPGHPRYTLQIMEWDTRSLPASIFQAELPGGAVKIDVLPIAKAPAKGDSE